MIMGWYLIDMIRTYDSILWFDYGSMDTTMAPFTAPYFKFVVFAGQVVPLLCLKDELRSSTAGDIPYENLWNTVVCSWENHPWAGARFHWKPSHAMLISPAGGTAGRHGLQGRSGRGPVNPWWNCATQGTTIYIHGSKPYIMLSTTRGLHWKPPWFSEPFGFRVYPERYQWNV